MKRPCDDCEAVSGQHRSRLKGMQHKFCGTPKFSGSVAVQAALHFFCVRYHLSNFRRLYTQLESGFQVRLIETWEHEESIEDREAIVDVDAAVNGVFVSVKPFPVHRILVLELDLDVVFPFF